MPGGGDPWQAGALPRDDRALPAAADHRADGGAERRGAAGWTAAGSTSPSGTASAAWRSRPATRSSCAPSPASRSARYFPDDGRAAAAPAGRALRARRRAGDRGRPARSRFDALQMRLHPAASRVRKLAGRDARRGWCSSTAGGRRRAERCSSARCRERRARAGGLVRAAWAHRRGCACRPRRPMSRQAGGWLAHAGAAPPTASSPSGWTSPIAPASGRWSRSSGCAPPTASSAASAIERERREVGSLLLGLYDERRQARPCRLHLDHQRTPSGRR